MAQYGLSVLFTQALLDTVVEANLTLQDWKGDLSRSLSEIKQGEEPFQEFVDRLLKAGRIFGDPQEGVPFVTQLSYENANAAHCGQLVIQSKDRLIWIYSSL